MKFVLNVGFWGAIVFLLGYALFHNVVTGAILTAMVCGAVLLLTL